MSVRRRLEARGFQLERVFKANEEVRTVPRDWLVQRIPSCNRDRSADSPPRIACATLSSSWSLRITRPAASATRPRLWYLADESIVQSALHVSYDVITGLVPGHAGTCTLWHSLYCYRLFRSSSCSSYKLCKSRNKCINVPCNCRSCCCR
jgi:hypothetical protein